MGQNILIATVGGSCAPVVCSVRESAPDFTIFICSSGSKGSRNLVDGPGKPCDERRTCPKCGHQEGETHPSIVAQSGLSAEQYDVVQVDVDNIDNIEKCAYAVEDAYNKALARDPEALIIADYTGGTKTMTAALVRLATGRHAQQSRLSVVTGQRGNLRTVVGGTETAMRHSAAGFALDEQWHAALQLFNGYHYASCDELLREISRQEPPPHLQRKVRDLTTLARGFDHWDRFDHANAYHLLHTVGTLAGPHLRDVKTLAKGVDAETGWGARHVLPVYDLLRNAERRAAQGRYDDAVARLYRALEMLAQNRLRTAHDIDTGGVDPGHLPEQARLRLLARPRAPATDEGMDEPVAGQAAGPGKRVRIGLRDGYLLLADLGDPVGRAFQARQTQLLTMLERRNKSILAHGTQPIGKKEYDGLVEPVEEMVAQASAETDIRIQPLAQFPHLTPDRFE